MKNFYQIYNYQTVIRINKSKKKSQILIFRNKLTKNKII